MADTLRWPGSLNKQIASLKEKHPKEPVLKLFPTLAIGLICFIIQLYFKNTGLTIILFLIWSFIVVLNYLGRKLWQTNIEREKLLKGLTGEELVAGLLDNLPEGWLIINDIKINGTQIDHIVIGPLGVFCLETKNWNNAGCDENGNWYRFHLGNWVSVKANPAEQNSAHVLSLKTFLNKKLGLALPICSIIVMANSNAKLNLAAKVVPPENTRICLPNELHQLILNNKGTELTPNEAHNIATMLANHQTRYQTNHS